MSIKNNIIIRAYFLYLLVITMGAVILCKVVCLQLDSSYEALEHDQYVTATSIPGTIFSLDDRILAVSVASYELRIDLGIKHLSSKTYQDIILELSRILPLALGRGGAQRYYNALEQARKAKNRYFLIEKRLSQDAVKALYAYKIFNQHKNSTGLILESKLERIYPTEDMALRTIGYHHANSAVGVEGAYSAFLASHRSKIEAKAGLGGAMIPIDLNYLGLNRGNDVRLTIHSRVQECLQKELKNTLIREDAESGTAILMDVKSGEIRAISNFVKSKDAGHYAESFNVAIGTAIEPGSTFKIASIMAGLEDNKFSLDDTVDVENGQTKFFTRVLRDVTIPRNRYLSIEDAFVTSSNVGISKCINDSYKVNPEQFLRRLKQFHLSSKLDLDLPGEAQPFIKGVQDPTWSKISLPWMSIGYELEITPIGLLAFYNAIANHARFVRPRFVKQILRRGKVVENFNSTVIDSQICSKTTLKRAQQLLRKAGAMYDDLSPTRSFYEISGKTGTAQIAQLNTGYKKAGRRTQYRSSFCGYFPADDPKYAMIVVVNDPKHHYYGIQVAYPTFVTIANQIYLMDTDHFRDIKHLILTKK